MKRGLFNLVLLVTALIGWPISPVSGHVLPPKLPSIARGGGEDLQTKLYHARSGLVYFGARWYSPSTGTWLSRDPSGEGSGINLYQYANSSPLNYVDPDGRSPILAVMIGAAVWAAVYTPLNANAPSEDSTQYEPTTPEEVAMNAAGGALAAGALSWAGSALGSLGSRNACPTTMTVTRWQTPPSTALKVQNWVVRGQKNPWNYLMSGKFNPLRSRYHVPYRNGRSFEVPPSTLRAPEGAEAFKTLPPWRQSQYFPPQRIGIRPCTRHWAFCFSQLACCWME